jgi:GNAT superfamily N-acetyltransferase
MADHDNITARVRINEASVEHIADITELLGKLGYPQTADFVKEKLKTLRKSENDVTLVADLGGKMAGFVHLHVAELFHEKGRLGRVMALSVAEDDRGKGLGQRLMQAVEEKAKAMGCVEMEVTSSVRRAGAHRFYKQLGYIEKPKRFVKSL